MVTGSSSSSEVKNAWRYTFTHPTCFHGVDRDVFTFCTLCENGVFISVSFYRVTDVFLILKFRRIVIM